MSLEKDLKKLEEGTREPGTFGRKFIFSLCILWSLFQLLTAQVLLLDSITVRSFHLAFALALVFLSFPAWSAKKIPWYDLLLALIAALSALYLSLNYEAISGRQGVPTSIDLYVGVILIILLIEGARRTIGLALPLISLIFILCSLFASSLPAFLASKDVSLSHLISKLTLSTEGIYGIPLNISAEVIFLFVLFGAMLERSSGGEYFVDLAYSLMGRFRGGAAKAAVLASGLTGMISGSSVANVVTTGNFTIPLMKRAGYPPIKAAAIEVAAGTNGQLMPPIMGAAAFIIAEYCNIDYLEVVRAAFIPAFICYSTLFYITHLEALKNNLKGLSKEELPNFFKVFVKGAHFLFPLSCLIYFLVIERRSPGQSAFYAILILTVTEFFHQVVLLKSLKKALKALFFFLLQGLENGGKNMMGIALAVSTAGIIVGCVSFGVGGKLTEVIAFLSQGSLIGTLIVTAIVSLILGIGLPTTANYIVMANLTVPSITLLAPQLGLIVPPIAAHLFCFYFGILADVTPPVALAAFAAAAIAKTNPTKTGIQAFYYDIRTALVPFLFIFNSDLLLINVTNWSEILWIFFTGLITMFSFAALTQNFLLIKNNLIESALLILVCILLPCPKLLSFHHPILLQFAALFLYASVFFIQKIRKKSNMILN